MVPTPGVQTAAAAAATRLTSSFILCVTFLVVSGGPDATMPTTWVRPWLPVLHGVDEGKEDWPIRFNAGRLSGSPRYAVPSTSSRSGSSSGCRSVSHEDMRECCRGCPLANNYSDIAHVQLLSVCLLVTLALSSGRRDVEICPRQCCI